jgi:VIT1/CCC1 family predicted Fe2+/Mn2+ transporter
MGAPPHATSPRADSVVRWLASADPSGLLYGAIVSATVLATASLHDDGPTRVAMLASGAVVIYWLADLYVHAISVRFDGDARGLLHRLGSAAAHKSSVLKGGLPAIVVYVVAHGAGAESTTAAYTALGFSVVLLTIVGYLGARQAGTPKRAATLEGMGAGVLGVIIMVAKSLLH